MIWKDSVKSSILKRVLFYSLIVVLTVSNVISISLYLSTTKENNERRLLETEDEISRTIWFIKDWYNELSADYGTAEVYFNELRFLDGKYTLTIAADKIRAVFPRGARFFRLENISYLEFFEDNNSIRCILFYNENGETVFEVN